MPSDDNFTDFNKVDTIESLKWIRDTVPVFGDETLESVNGPLLALVAKQTKERDDE